MARTKQSPFWNQDTIMAGGLAFAGMAVLESKLFPTAAQLNLPWLNRLLDWKFFELWPVVLIAAGVVVWIMKAREMRSHRDSRHIALVGVKNGTRDQNQD